MRTAERSSRRGRLWAPPAAGPWRPAPGRPPRGSRGVAAAVRPVSTSARWQVRAVASQQLFPSPDHAAQPRSRPSGRRSRSGSCQHRTYRPLCGRGGRSRGVRSSWRTGNRRASQLLGRRAASVRWARFPVAGRTGPARGRVTRAGKPAPPGPCGASRRPVAGPAWRGCCRCVCPPRPRRPPALRRSPRSTCPGRPGPALPAPGG